MQKVRRNKLLCALALTTPLLTLPNIASAALDTTHSFTELEARNLLAVAKKLQKFQELQYLGKPDNWTEVSTSWVTTANPVISYAESIVDYCSGTLGVTDYTTSSSNNSATITSSHTAGAVDYVVTNSNYSRTDGDGAEPRTVTITQSFDVIANGYDLGFHVNWSATRKNWMCSATNGEMAVDQTLTISVGDATVLTATRVAPRDIYADTFKPGDITWNITAGSTTTTSPKGDITTLFNDLDMSAFAQSVSTTTSSGGNTGSTGTDTNTADEPAAAAAINFAWLMLGSLMLLFRRKLS